MAHENESNVQIGVDGVVAEVVLFEHRVLQLVATLLDILLWKECMRNCNSRVKKQGTYVNFRIVDLERVHVIVVFLDLIYDRVVSYLG